MFGPNNPIFTFSLSKIIMADIRVYLSTVPFLLLHHFRHLRGSLPPNKKDLPVILLRAEEAAATTSFSPSSRRPMSGSTAAVARRYPNARAAFALKVAFSLLSSAISTGMEPGICERHHVASARARYLHRLAISGFRNPSGRIMRRNMR